MDIVWADSAKAQLRGIRDYIGQVSNEYAQLTIERIFSSVERIAVFPMSGRSVPEYGYKQIREVYARPYRVMYHIRSDCIEIIAIVHGRQSFSE